MKSAILRRRENFRVGGLVAILPFDENSPYWKYREIKPLAIVVITDVYMMRLSDVVENDIAEEGIKATIDEYIKEKCRKFKVKPSALMTKVRFEYVN